MHAAAPPRAGTGYFFGILWQFQKRYPQEALHHPYHSERARFDKEAFTFGDS
jgi:hypothetical protein